MPKHPAVSCREKVLITCGNAASDLLQNDFLRPLLGMFGMFQNRGPQSWPAGSSQPVRNPYNVAYEYGLGIG
jgi:hypothetical protein